MGLQRKLLRVPQEDLFERIGEGKPHSVDVSAARCDEPRP